MAPSFLTAASLMPSTIRRESYDSNDSDSYFSTTYVPLSNLPTPPLSSHSSNSSRDHIPVLDLNGDLDRNLLGPACYLRNLIPSAVSLLDPEIRIIQPILAFAALPLPTVALAACILDSLNRRFALSWRCSFPLTTLDSPELGEVHIDSIRPEVIILAALIISTKFLDDEQTTTRLYSEEWGSGRWTCSQINATEQVIMENLGYRVLPLWNEQLISDALDEMDRAGRYASRRAVHSMPRTPDMDLNAVGFGTALWSAEEKQPPSVKTPMCENVPGSVEIASETEEAFGTGHDSAEENTALPKMTRGEIFPPYRDPFLGA